VNYDVVCESCHRSVVRAPHIGDPEADRMAAHMREHHDEVPASGTRDAFADLLKQFRVRMAD